MNQQITFNQRAFAARLATGVQRETKSDDLADSINQIADRFETFRDRIETRMARPGFGLEASASSGDTEERLVKPTAAERKAFGQMLRTGDRRLAMEAKASINATNSGEGLEAIAQWFDSEVLRQARDMAPLLKIVRTRRASNFPCRHLVGDSRAMGSGWSGDLGVRAETDPPVPRHVDVVAGEWYARPTVSEWALADASFDVEAWLRQELIDEYSETCESAIVAGNGTDKPKGFLAGPAPVTTADGARAFGTLRYHPTGVAAALPATSDAAVNLLLDVVHGLRWKHRAKASWVMNSVTMATWRKFKTLDGMPILLDSMTNGQPTTLLGYPVVESEAMPAIGAGAFPVAFGDFSAGYVIDQDSAGMRITRDDITTPGLVKFYARRRIGGNILDSDAIRLIKVSVA